MGCAVISLGNGDRLLSRDPSPSSTAMGSRHGSPSGRDRRPSAPWLSIRPLTTALPKTSAPSPYGHLLVLTVRYSDSTEVSKQERIKPASCWEADLLPHLRALFQRLFRRRVRLNRLTVGVGGLAAREEQLSLFEDDASSPQPSPERARRLAAALDHVSRRYGERVLRYGHQIAQG